MGKNVRLADIGARLGVSTVTVSKALSGQKGVSEELREKIIALAGELGYKRELTPKKTPEEGGYTIGVLIAEKYIGKYDSFYLKMYQTVNVGAVERGSLALLITIDGQTEKECLVPKVLQENKLDGLMIIGRLESGYLEAIHRVVNVPWVFVDFYDGEDKADAVISDSYYGAYQMTRYLLKRGHRRIAYVGTLLSTNSITDRYLGYTRAMLEYGITPKPEWQIDDRDPETGLVDEQKLFRFPKEMPTAFFCNCDVVGSIVIKKLRSLGYRVPEDISVVGYDNYLYPGLCDIGITTYEVDMKKMAAQALDILLEKLSVPDSIIRLHIVEGHMVEKDSVKNIDFFPG